MSNQSQPDDLNEQLAALLQPLLIGLIGGTHKLVIESRVHGDRDFGEFNHTIKVVPCDP